MFKTFTLVGIFMILGLLASGQTMSVNLDELKFDSPTEQAYWEHHTVSQDHLSLFRAVHASESQDSKKWEELVSILDKKFDKKGKSENFIRTIFEKSHQNLFKSYEKHATFNQMLNDGRFDCVSGTATLGMLLDRYGFEYEIIETDYHVFLVVNHEEKPILLESTLRVGGMITSPSEVEKYIQAYLPGEKGNYLNLNQRIGSPDILDSEKTIFRKVSLSQLAGLQYYNDAIMHFNEQAYRVAASQLEKAHNLYDSDRIEGLKDLAIDQAYKNLGVDLKK